MIVSSFILFEIFLFFCMASPPFPLFFCKNTTFRRFRQGLFREEPRLFPHSCVVPKVLPLLSGIIHNFFRGFVVRATCAAFSPAPRIISALWGNAFSVNPFPITRRDCRTLPLLSKIHKRPYKLLFEMMIAKNFTL